MMRVFLSMIKRDFCAHTLFSYCVGTATVSIGFRMKTKGVILCLSRAHKVDADRNRKCLWWKTPPVRELHVHPVNTPYAAGDRRFGSGHVSLLVVNWGEGRCRSGVRPSILLLNNVILQRLRWCQNSRHKQPVLF